MTAPVQEPPAYVSGGDRMRRGTVLRKVVRASAVVGVLVLSLITAPTGAQAEVGDTATGSGTLVGDWPHCPFGSTVTFSFSADGAAGGGAAGAFSFNCGA